VLKAVTLTHFKSQDEYIYMCERMYYHGVLHSNRLNRCGMVNFYAFISLWLWQHG